MKSIKQELQREAWRPTGALVFGLPWVDTAKAPDTEARNHLEKPDRHLISKVDDFTKAYDLYNLTDLALITSRFIN